MEGSRARAIDDFSSSRTSPGLWVAIFYLVFFVALFLVRSVDPTPAQFWSGAFMAVSAGSWTLCLLYRAAWVAAHRRNQAAISVAGDPLLEIGTYSRMVETSRQVFIRIQVIAVFVCLPIAVLAVTLFVTSCFLQLFTS